jgi:hypothetical protein
MAARLWQGHKVPGVPVKIAANLAAKAMRERPGRVESGGAFEQSDFLAALRGALPDNLQSSLRPRLEWYGCRGAFFHNDAHYDGVLFGVWCVLGPQRELVFPRVATSLPACTGDLAVFDPFEPHGVLKPGARSYQSEDYADAELSLFLGFELALTPAVRAAFGIGDPHVAAPTFSSRIAIHPATGAAVT